MATTILGWGYEGKTISDLLDTLEANRVHTVVDIRLTPISRKKGFSKTRLRQAVESTGTRYVHMRSLGNPKDNRAAFAHPGTPEAHAAHARFRNEVLATPDARVAIHEIADLAHDGTILVHCFEDNHLQCHRKLVIEETRAVLEESERFAA